MKLAKALFLTFFLFFFTILPASANSQKVTINDLQNYFNNLTSIESEFTQIDTTNIKREGKFYLSKPKKIRLDYFTQDKEQIFLAHNQFILFNPILDEVSYMPASRVPISFLSKNIILGDNVHVLDFNQDSKSVNVKVKVPLKDSDYVDINLSFKKNPLSLNTITYNDLISGKTVILRLNNAFINQGIDKKIFEFDNPHF